MPRQSSPWDYVSRLWTVQQFTIETDNGWGRSQLRRIDRQLGVVKATEHGDPNRYVAELARLIDECREWMVSKEKKFARKAPTRSYLKRLAAITKLMNQALQHLKFFAFEGQKAKGDHSRVGLKPGYDRERREFEAMKQYTNANYGLRLDPHSSSFVTAGLLSHLRPNRQWYPDIDSLLNKDVDTMTDDEFQFLSRQLRQDWGVELSNGGLLPRVHYVRKQERINNNMLIPIGGLLYKDSGHHPYTSAGRNGRDIYAIDRYGNLMSVADDAQFDDGSFKSEHRHSSLNAGNRVICAGYIAIEQGIIKYLDNKSGHYKPTEKDLACAVRTLMDEHDLDLTGTQIIAYKSTGPNSVVRSTDVTGGQHFLNIVGPPLPPRQPGY